MSRPGSKCGSGESADGALLSKNVSDSEGVTDGFRTRDNWSHNPVLYQLSYGHREAAAEDSGSGHVSKNART